MVKVSALGTLAVCAGIASAQFGNIFEHMFQQQHEQHQQHAQQHAQNQIPDNSNWLEQEYIKSSCDQYLCEDTLACVKSPVDCPCKFPTSQLKCTLPDKKNYVCISKPASEGDRDCSFVQKAWKGQV